MKKGLFSIFIIIFFILLSTENVLARDNVTSNKKVVSLVFDDSGSMQRGNGEKAENANYALQSLISMLGKDDELNIVRMSAPYSNNEMKINQKTSKQNSIDEIKTWKSVGGTPFQAVDTAKNWLNTKKAELNDNAEYWLIIITDGLFEQYVDMDTYMREINQNFTGLNFNAMLVGIGKDIIPEYTQAFRNSPNLYSQEIETVEKIIPTMFEISSQINSGVNIQAIDAQKIDTNKIYVDLSLPINKMNIFIQKNGLKITNIETANNKQIDFDTYDIATDKRTAQMNEILTSKGYLESGKYIITFNEEVDLNATQIKILVRSAVTNELRLYKRTEKEDIELEDIDFFTIKEDDEIIAKSKLISFVDGQKIELDNLKNVDGYYYINDKKVYGKLENGELVTKIPLELGKNTIYSLIESEGYIKEKSNTRVINLINLQEILIQYNNSDKYEKSEEIELREMSDVINITLNNLPEGVVVEYDGIEYSNGEKILLNGNNKILEVKANKDYRETSSKIVEITANEEGKFKQTESNKNYFRIAPKTTKYEFVKVDKNQNEIDMDNKLLKLEIQYEGFKNIEKLDLTNIQKIKIDNLTNSYKITTKTNKQTNEIELNIKPTILSIFTERKVNFQIEGEIKQELGSAFGQFELGITNYNILEVLLPWIIVIIIIIIIFGYIFKNRFNKNGYITISSESQPYSLKQCAEGKRKYLPFVADIAQLPNIKVKAKKANKIQVISCFDEIVEINGETDIPKDMNLSMNNGTLTLKIDGKNVKYEYVVLTADEIIETSEENNQKDENYF